jgi:hypothetical protein
MGFLEDIINHDAVSKHIDQGSEEWEQIRCGRFTSSEIHKIMECGKRPMTPEELAARPKKGKGSQTTLVPDPSKMSPDGLKYINQKVAEVLTGKPKPPAYAYPLVYGKETEPQAVEYFEQKFGIACEEVGFQPWTDHAGGSPDRLIGTDQGLEVKCPFASEMQVQYLMLNDRHDLKRMFPEYYWQCVSLMLFTGRQLWHFVTFDPRMILDKHKITHLEIFAKDVEEDMDSVNKAIEGAVKEKLKLLSLL